MYCYTVRLAGGPSAYEGRLEVLHDSQWGTVCGDRYFTDKAAQVACNMFGLHGSFIVCVQLLANKMAMLCLQTVSVTVYGTSAHKRPFSAMQWLKAELGVSETY